MPHIDKRKSREKGTPIIDFGYIFFGRHRKEREVKYFTVFVFSVILITLAAFYLQPQAQELFFMPGPEATEYGPRLVSQDSVVSWQFSLPEGTAVGAADSGTLFPAFGPDAYVIKSPDEKWLLVHAGKNIEGRFITVEPDAAQYPAVYKGNRLFRIGGGDSNFAFYVIKLEGDCLYSQDKICPYVNPEEYFSAIRGS